MSVEDARREVNAERENRCVVTERQHRMKEREATHARMADLDVRDLKRHADDERKVREIVVVRLGRAARESRRDDTTAQRLQAPRT